KLPIRAQQVSERDSLEQLHHQIGETPCRNIEIQNAYRVWMVHSAGGDSLEPESLQTLDALTSDCGPKDFDRHRMVKENMLAAINRAESSRSKLRSDSILVVEHVTRQRFRKRGEYLLGATCRAHVFRSRLGEQLILHDQLG